MDQGEVETDVEVTEDQRGGLLLRSNLHIDSFELI